jgi:hypothetical protein
MPKWEMPKWEMPKWEVTHFDRFSFSVLQYWRLHTGETIKTALYESKF